MAKKPGETNQVWSPDDLSLLASEQEILVNRLNHADEIIASVDQRLSKVESDVITLDVNKTSLPVDYIQDLKVSQLFIDVLSASTQAMILSQPQLIRDKKFQMTQIDTMIDFAETLVNRVCERANAKVKSKLAPSS